jgi:polysaccharide biosynthesis transport protein
MSHSTLVVPPARPEPTAPPSPMSDNGVSPNNQTTGESLELTQLFQAARRRWLTALVLGLGMAAVACWAGSFWIPSNGTARTLLHLASRRPVLLYETPENRTDFNIYQREQIGILKSRVVLNYAVERVRKEPSGAAFGPDTVAWLGKDIQADYTIAPEILRVTLHGDDPQQMLPLLNAVASVYLELVVNRDRADRQERLGQLNKLAGEYEQTLQKKREELADSASAFGSRDVALLRSKNQYRASQITSLQGELMRVRAQLNRAVASLPSAPASTPDEEQQQLEAALDAQVQADPQATQLRAEIARLEQDVIQFQRVANQSDDLPSFRRLLDSIQRAREALAGRRKQLEQSASQQLQLQGQRSRALFLAQERQHRAALQQEEQFLEKQLERYSTEASTLTGGMFELDRRQADIAQLETIARQVADRHRALEVELQAPPQARLLEEAVVIPGAEAKRQLKIGLLAGAAFCVSVLAVGWLESQRGRIHGWDEVTRHLGDRRVVALPPLPTGDLAQMCRPGASPSLGWIRWQDSIDTARTILLPSPRGTGLVILVTSAGPREGKTTLASQLALSLARGGLRTLLIDADRRRSSVHHLFGLPRGPGLGELLQDGVDLSRAIQNGPLPRLGVITRGAALPEGTLDTMQSRLPTLFAQCKELADIVIVDAPPLLSVPDALLLSMHADGVILSVVSDLSRLKALRLSCQRLDQLGRPIIGVVVNGVKPDHSYSAA